VKSISSPEKTPLSDDASLGVEAPEATMSSKKPSTAMTDRPVRSSSRTRNIGKDAAHCPTLDESAPGATRTNFSNVLWDLKISVNVSGRLVGDVKEKDDS
jgi:hypothetical protein